MRNEQTKSTGSNGEERVPWTASQRRSEAPDEGSFETSSDGTTSDGVKKEAGQPQAGEPGSPIGQRARAAFDQGKQKLQSGVQAAKRGFKPLDEWMRTNAREHPYFLAATTAGTGFLAGMLIRHSRKLAIGLSMGVLVASYLSQRAAVASSQSSEPMRQ